MVIWNYKNHTHQWEKQKVDYSESIRYDSGQAVFFFTLAIGLFAFITPSISWREIRDFLREWNQSTQSEAAEMLGIQEQAVSSQSAALPKPSLPRDHLLTGGFAQSQKIVMTIRTGELPPTANPSLVGDIPRYYWRSVTYDVYVGEGWVTSSAPPSTYEANTPLIPGLLDQHRLLYLDVQMVQPEGKLFWSGILFSADIPFTADWRVRPQPSLFADQSALLQADMFAAASNANAYKAQSYVPDATEEQLRASPANYPENIRERYLSLPRSVPDRVHQLAREIVAGKTNPFDKAKAIETYLRTYPYDLEVPTPPQGQDVADYFLFDLKKGYCDYYATAMVVLARSSGLPARFVSGYSSGSYDAPNAEYVVRELNAHSWVEIYFPEIGWVEFEPTASQPVIDRLPAEAILPQDQGKESPASTLLNRYRTELLLVWLSPVIVIFLIALLYFTVIERWYYMRLSPKAAIERIYQRLYHFGRPLVGHSIRGETAFEFSNRLNHKIDEVKHRTTYTNLFHKIKNDVNELTNIYYLSLFSQQHTHRKDAIAAFNTWEKLRLRLMIARLMSLRGAFVPTKQSPH
jgi:transglutaminase-like putative cysteine protease